MTNHTVAFVSLDEIKNKSGSLAREGEITGIIIGILCNSLREELRRAKQIEVVSSF
ncbi:hypothetical protein [Methylotuvimicrobium sp. KM1]|uniref:hypothetical protein n=1 Tax=Methylotuvimicrobium sp. KM1 TaxID=3377707 RepID=UPI00384CC5D0